MSKTVIIGAGPAGLTAAWELARHGHDAVVFEQDDIVGAHPILNPWLPLSAMKQFLA